MDSSKKTQYVPSDRRPGGRPAMDDVTWEKPSKQRRRMVMTYFKDDEMPDFRYVMRAMDEPYAAAALRRLVLTEARRLRGTSDKPGDE